MAPRYPAPAALRRDLERTFARGASTAHPKVHGPTWLQAAALVAVAAIASAAIGFRLGQPPAQDPLPEAVVIRHPTALRARGFSVVTWTDGGLTLAAISDIDGRELSTFALLVRETGGGAPQ